MKVTPYTQNSREHRPAVSIADQFRTCFLQAKKQDLTIVAEYSDQATSASTLIPLPDIWALTIDALCGGVQVVLVNASDRLPATLGDIAALYGRLHLAGVQMITRTTGDVLELPVGLKAAMKALFLKGLEDNVRHGMMARDDDLVAKACC